MCMFSHGVTPSEIVVACLNMLPTCSTKVKFLHDFLEIMKRALPTIEDISQETCLQDFVVVLKQMLQIYIKVFKTCLLGCYLLLIVIDE